MSEFQSNSDEQAARGLERRRLLRGASIGAGAAALVANGAALLGASPAEAQTAAQLTDVNILNFALNLEYLEAEFYLRATSGTGLVGNGVGVTGGDGSAAGTVIAPTGPISFATPAIQAYANEISTDEKNHVAFIRAVLGSQAVAEPAIDLTDTFNAIGAAAGIGSTFNPFASENGFLVGAFVFEDVGVTAYHGAAPYVRNRTYLSAAAGILAVEAYHASELRTILYQRGSQTIGNTTILQAVNAISALRGSLDGSPNGGNDQGITDAMGNPNIVPTDSNSIAFSRTPNQVLNIVYASATGQKGGFFPNGLNGALS